MAGIANSPDISRHEFRAPPEGRRLNHEGHPRHVGVEIEFAAVTAEAATGIVQSLFGGDIEVINAHLFKVKGTELGDFQCELDFQYAHAAPDLANDEYPAFREFETKLREMIGNISALLAPCEIVCPPIEIAQLPRIEDLRQALREAGAQGTDESFLYAFGAQLNPEIASDSPEYIVTILKAYLLLSDWLRAEIEVDPARDLLAFADPFPQAYRELVLGAGYKPSIDVLIGDYLAYNPTRNRELDMLPLFCWLDEPRIREAVPNDLIKSRPTFHYRLPNARLQDPDWTIASEWNRWCRVEYLANAGDKLDEACRSWENSSWEPGGSSWDRDVKKWLM